MCFSAIVSFAASAVLLPTGLYSLHLAHRQNPRYLPLAAIPIAFAVQQACEGLGWLGIGAESKTETRLGALGFLAFAYWFWLFWTPWAVAQIEVKQTVRQICWGMGWLGLGYGALLYLPLLDLPLLEPLLGHPPWLSIHVVQQSIQYETRLIFDPWMSQDVDRLFYAMIILIPLGSYSK